MTVSFSTTKYDSKTERNKVDVCNASGCDRVGTIKTDVDCGIYGILEIIVCDKCISKFSREES
ncbi:hypothetical protein [Candidatus Nitrosocosmicus arcticus]|uniref:Uncharacterized protein n=1 Tax=Candidatus Nitrosocosmicus arcticus TaxID=2035267 RepID=A0A557SV18_9ARCH|nr:hypothetical protein [Candidatus Nitrosocosmicus arcticus]TVP40447.1 hypothetical protein NARC_70024 [Candidatus Nitrosocosmicus arcticus]